MTDLTALAPAALPGTTSAGDRLLDAAEELFTGRGIGAVGVDLIAERAGVTKRTLYQRFGSKQDLVARYLQRRAVRWQTLLLATIGGLAPEDQVLAVFSTAQRWAADNERGCSFVNAWAEIDAAEHPAAAVIRAEKRWMRALFTQLAPDDASAEHLHLLYEGAQVTASTLGDPRAFAHAGQLAADLLRPTSGAAQR